MGEKVRSKLKIIFADFKRNKFSFGLHMGTRLKITDALKYYINGSGIEVGPLHRPFNLKGLPITNIQYVDCLSEDELRIKYPELSDCKLTRIDIVDDGEKLSKISEESLDFIIAKNFIEHARNPIGTIESWLSKLRKGGTIFMVVPDKRRIFDKKRPLTKLEHFIEDYNLCENERRIRDREHFWEWSTLVAKVPEWQVKEYTGRLIDRDFSIHFHTFTLQTFLELVHYLKNEMSFPIEITACADTLRDGHEFVVVLSRS